MTAGEHRSAGSPGWSRTRKVTVALLGALIMVALAAGIGSLVFYQRLSSNITAQDVGPQLGTARPVAPPPSDPASPAVNILVIGSDTRKDNPAEGSDKYGPPRSDTTIVLHLSADRQRAEAVSIPRDSLVDIPACTRTDGTVTPPRRNRAFNEAFSDGVGCTYRTVEQITGVHIDHYVEVDFAGFKRMVDALGGVQVCLPKAVNDSYSHLNLTAGRHLVRGNTALAYVRLRHNIGDGSDLGRIQRQQAFLSSIIQKATSRGTLLNPLKLVPFLDAATQSVTSDMGTGQLRELAQRVRSIGISQITFLTVPNVPAPRNPARIVWAQPAAGRLWLAVGFDQPVPGTPAARAAATGASPSPSIVDRTRSPRPSASPSFTVRTADQSICG